MDEKVYFKVQQVLEEDDSKALVKKQSNFKGLLLSYVLICLIFIYFNLRYWSALSVGMCVFLVLLTTLLAFRFPARTAKLTMRNARILTGSPIISDEITFGEEYFYENVPNRSTRYTYRQIVRVHETKRHYFLMLSGSLGIIVKKDAFVFGEGATFVAFIEAKRQGK